MTRYQGTGRGMNGEIKVEIIIEENELKDIQVLTHQESPSISDRAISELPQTMVKRQSTDVDVVSGATMTSHGIKQAVESALNQAEIQLTEREDTEKSFEELSDLEADVVIIGGGGTGLAAAVSAVKNQASVLVLEKMPSLGGSTVMAGGQYNAVDRERQEKYNMNSQLIEEIEKNYENEPVNATHERLMSELKEQVEAYKEEGAKHLFDSPQLHALQTFEGGDRVGDLDLIERLTVGAEQSIKDLEELDVAFQDEIAIVTGALWQRTHQFVKPLVTGPLDAYEAFLAEHPEQARIITDVAAKELIKENGRVTGVVAEKNGATIDIQAHTGVIIATGGFAQNNDMVLDYNEAWKNLEGLGSTNSISATGDGIKLASDAGADLVGMEHIQLLPVGDPETGGMQGNISINAANQIFVNNRGERFVAEDERRDVLTKGLLQQPDQEMFIIHDAHEYYDENVKNDFDESIGQLVESGKVVKGNNMEELAEAMGVDSDQLQETFADYNAVVRGEKKDEYGKHLVQDELNKAPFYASRRVPTIHHTMGGLRIDTDARVLDKNKQPIAGLFAAGEVAGGIHGANRLGGNAIPDTVVFGKIAGRTAASKNNTL